MSYHFIINNAAGGGKPEKRWPALRKVLDENAINYTYSYTEYKGHAEQLINHALSNGERKFVAVGGDGSVSEVVNALFKQKIVQVSDCFLSVIPWGTGNDWAAYYGLSQNYNDIVNRLKIPSIKQQDIGKAVYQNDKQKNQVHYCMNFLGTGFDSYLLEKMQSAGGQRWRYYWYVLKCLKSYSSSRIVLTVGGESYNIHALMLMACIGKYGGAGMKFAPTADANDGLFNVLCINDISFSKRLLSLAYLFNGKVNSHPAVQTWEADSISFSAEEKLYFQCDGELIACLDVDISFSDQLLNVMT